MYLKLLYLLWFKLNDRRIQSQTLSSLKKKFSERKSLLIRINCKLYIVHKKTLLLIKTIKLLIRFLFR